MADPGKPHHLLISGTGRAGTTFLVQWLTAAGLDTGCESRTPFTWARAGLEHRLSADRDLPYVVKDPSLHEYLPGLLERAEVVCDGIIVPIRPLRDVAASRAMQSRASLTMRPWDFHDYAAAGDIPGGLLHSYSVADQVNVMARAQANLLELASQYRIPVAMPHFPELVQEFAALWESVGPLLEDMLDEATALAAFEAVADPSKVRFRSKRHPNIEPDVAEALLVELEARNRALNLELADLRRELTAVRQRNQTLTASLRGAEALGGALQQQLRAAQIRERDLRRSLRLTLELATGRATDPVAEPGWQAAGDQAGSAPADPPTEPAAATAGPLAGDALAAVLA